MQGRVLSRSSDKNAVFILAGNINSEVRAQRCRRRRWTNEYKRIDKFYRLQYDKKIWRWEKLESLGHPASTKEEDTQTVTQHLVIKCLDLMLTLC